MNNIPPPKPSCAGWGKVTPRDTRRSVGLSRAGAPPGAPPRPAAGHPTPYPPAVRWGQSPEQSLWSQPLALRFLPSFCCSWFRACSRETPNQGNSRMRKWPCRGRLSPLQGLRNPNLPSHSEGLNEKTMWPFRTYFNRRGQSHISCPEIHCPWFPLLPFTRVRFIRSLMKSLDGRAPQAGLVPTLFRNWRECWEEGGHASCFRSCSEGGRASQEEPGPEHSCGRYRACRLATDERKTSDSAADFPWSADWGWLLRVFWFLLVARPPLQASLSSACLPQRATGDPCNPPTPPHILPKGSPQWNQKIL